MCASGNEAYTELFVDPRVDDIQLPENLRVGLMVNAQRERCRSGGCAFDFVGLAFGQSPFPVPAPLQRALARHVDKGHYAPAAGIPELRAAVAGFQARHFGLEVDPERIVIGPGTKDLIFTLFTLLGGHVLIPSPSWIGYFPQLRLLGKTYHPIRLREKHGYKLTPAQLEAALGPILNEGNQHLLVLNNPHNPTGTVYTRAELAALAEVCRRRRVFVLADEIYALTTYAPEQFTSMASVYPEATFVTNGLSKDRSAGGYRLGSCILPSRDTPRLRDAFVKIAATIYTNVSTPTQHGAVDAYEPDEELEAYFRDTRAIHAAMGMMMFDELSGVEGLQVTRPAGGFYLYADFNAVSDALRKAGVRNSNALGRSLLACPYHVATVTGDALMLDPFDYGARIAFVDYDGAEALAAWREDPPEDVAEARTFARRLAPNMTRAGELIGRYLEEVRAGRKVNCGEPE